MQKAPAHLVTVVAICYNQSQFLEESLNSILAQTITGFDFHIIDDCSKDDSASRIQQWIEKTGVKVTFHPHEENWGLTRTMNHALSLCQTKYFQPWPCDDVMLPHKLDHQIAYLESLDWEPGFLYGDISWMDENSTIYRKSVLEFRKTLFPNNQLPQGNVFKELVQFGCFIPTASGIYNTQALRDLGGFDETLWAEDWDMFMRIALKQGIAANDEVVSLYRRHPNSTEMTKGLKYWNGHFKILPKYLGLNTDTDAIIWQAIFKDALKAFDMGYKPAFSWMGKSFFKQPTIYKIKSFAAILRNRIINKKPSKTN
jgi:alpha-1,3-rhamnosyltransferase